MSRLSWLRDAWFPRYVFACYSILSLSLLEPRDWWHALHGAPLSKYFYMLITYPGFLISSSIVSAAGLDGAHPGVGRAVSSALWLGQPFMTSALVLGLWHGYRFVARR